MSRRFANVLVLLCSVALANCGGGGGGGGSAVPPTSGGGATPTPAATPTLMPEAIGEVHTLQSLTTAGSSLAFDTDDGTALFDVGGSILAASPVANYPSAHFSNVAAMTYSSAGHALLVANGTTIYSVTKGSAPVSIATGLTNVLSMTTDMAGNIFVIDNDHVSEIVNGAPKALTAAGTIPNPSGSDVTAYPAITFDSTDGALYVANTVHNAVERVTLSGAVSTVAGLCTAGASGGGPTYCEALDEPGVGLAAIFGTLSGIVYDPHANVLYVTDALNNQIWSVSTSGNASIIAGYGPGPVTPIDGNGRSAFLYDPYVAAFDPAGGRLYIREGRARDNDIASYATTGATQPSFEVPATLTWMPSHDATLSAIALASDDSAWVVEQNGPSLAHVTTTGSVSEFGLPLAGVSQGAGTLALDAQGNAWSAQAGMGGAEPGACSDYTERPNFNLPIAGRERHNFGRDCRQRRKHLVFSKREFVRWFRGLHKSNDLCDHGVSARESAIEFAATRADRPRSGRKYVVHSWADIDRTRVGDRPICSAHIAAGDWRISHCLQSRVRRCLVYRRSNGGRERDGSGRGNDARPF